MSSKNLLKHLLSTWWGASVHPGRWFAECLDGGGASTWWALAFAAVVAAPAVPAGMLVDAALLGAPMEGALLRAGWATILGPAAFVFGVIVSAAVAHVALRAMGVEGGTLRHTVRCVGFSSGPEVFAAIPWVGPMVAGVWRLVVLARALQVTHGIPAYRAAIAVLSGPFWLVCIGLVFRLTLFDSFKIPAGSMIPTLEPGDHVLVRRGPYEPKRGDVMVFRFPADPSQFYVKRVIGLEGDEIRMVGPHPRINGWPVPYCTVGAYEPGRVRGDWPARGTLFMEFLGGSAYLVYVDRIIAHELGSDACRQDADCRDGHACRDALCVERAGPFEVASNEYWVLGDNRFNSHDSRSWYEGRGGGVHKNLVTGPTLVVLVNVTRAGELDFTRTGLPVGKLPELTGPNADALRGRVAWCLKHRPAIADATPPPPHGR